MKRASLLAMGLLAAAVPVEAQMFNFPDYSIRSGAPATVIATHYGRGLNDNSGKLNAFGLIVARSGIGGRFSARAGLGMVDANPDNEITFGGAIQARFTEATSPTSLAVLAGIGYMKVDPFTFTRFPIGVSVGRNIVGESATVSPWVMPRLDISRASASGLSTTETNFGASGGVTVIMTSGLGFHFALDMVAGDPSVWQAGGGVQYVIQ